MARAPAENDRNVGAAPSANVDPRIKAIFGLVAAAMILIGAYLLISGEKNVIDNRVWACFVGAVVSYVGGGVITAADAANLIPRISFFRAGG